jgi:hypothetical protein
VELFYVAIEDLMQPISEVIAGPRFQPIQTWAFTSQLADKIGINRTTPVARRNTALGLQRKYEESRKRGKRCVVRCKKNEESIVYVINLNSDHLCESGAKEEEKGNHYEGTSPPSGLVEIRVTSNNANKGSVGGKDQTEGKEVQTERKK